MMAAWQFALVLVPSAWLDLPTNGIDDLVDGDGYDTFHAWLEHEPKVDLASLIEPFFAPAQAWCNDILYWGEAQHNDVMVVYEDGLVESIRIRIDVSKNSIALRAHIVAIADALNCVFFLPEEKMVIEPDEAALGAAIMLSSAARFVSDPRAHLQGLAK